jgi:class 3 adenylate cyclase
MAENTNRTFICSVLFLDIVGYSTRKVPQQIVLKERFNAILTEAIAGVAADDRVILDTGDGAAVSFLGDPEDALFAGMALRDTVAGQEPVSGKPLQIRIGINLGPVRLVKDINRNLNIIGDGINVAQRVMSFAQPGQILVSRSYYDVMAPLSEDYASLFRHKGTEVDKQLREHELWEIGPAPSTVRPTAHAPAQKLRLRMPRLRLLRFPKLRFHAPAGAAVNSKLFVAAPLAFFLIVGTGVIARSYRTTNSELKLAANPAPQPPQAVASSRAELPPPANPTEVAASKALEPAPSTQPVQTVTPPQRTTAPAHQAQAKPPAETAAPRTTTAPRAARPDTKAKEERENAAADPKESETVALAAPAPRDASIKILAFPWAEVYIDGQRQGVSPPLRAIPVKPGRHRVELRNSSFPAHSETVEAKSGAEISVRHRFRR